MAWRVRFTKKWLHTPGTDLNPEEGADSKPNVGLRELRKVYKVKG